MPGRGGVWGCLGVNFLKVNQSGSAPMTEPIDFRLSRPTLFSVFGNQTSREMPKPNRCNCSGFLFARHTAGGMGSTEVSLGLIGSKFGSKIDIL